MKMQPGDKPMKTVQVFYEPNEDPAEVAERARMAYPEADRYRFNLILSPICMRPSRVTREKQIHHQGKLFSDEKKVDVFR
jgi:hypothetical protein